MKNKDADISQEGAKIINIIEQNLKEQMIKRSYVQSGDPSLFLRYELISNQKSSRISNNSNPYSPFYYSYSPMLNASAITESVLLLELFDAKTQKLIWQASLDLNKYAKKSKKEVILSEAIAQLFDTYLYKANSNNIDQSLKSDQ